MAIYTTVIASINLYINFHKTFIKKIGLGMMTNRFNCGVTWVQISGIKSKNWKM